MFGIGPQEIVIIVIGALIIFGPQRLPEIAAQAGKALRDFRRMKDELTGELRQSLTLDDPTTPDRPLTDTVAAASAAPLDSFYTPAPPPTNRTIAPDAEPATTGEADAVRARGGIADARAAAIHPEATSSPARPGPAGDVSTTGTVPPVAGPSAYAPPQREPVVPHAEPTMREKIEAQIAAEAFRERRRLANYQRARKRD